MTSENVVDKMTQKVKFLEALSQRDLVAIEQILEDNITYFGASKNDFISKMAFIFNQMTLAGQKGYLKLMQHKKHKNTFYIYSDVFNKSYKFIIEEDNGKLLKVYNSKKVRSVDDAEQISDLDLYFGEDERVGFKPSAIYLKTLYECKSAYEELEKNTINIITSLDINNWLVKHTLLFDKVYPQYQYFKLNDFRNLFFIIKWYFEILQKSDRVKVALKDFKNCKIEEIDDWCVHYNRLYFCETMGFQSLPLIIEYKNRRIRFNNKSNIYFTGDDFFAIVRFNEIFLNCFNTSGINNSRCSH